MTSAGTRRNAFEPLRRVDPVLFNQPAQASVADSERLGGSGLVASFALKQGVNMLTLPERQVVFWERPTISDAAIVRRATGT